MRQNDIIFLGSCDRLGQDSHLCCRELIDSQRGLTIDLIEETNKYNISNKALRNSIWIDPWDNRSEVKAVKSFEVESTWKNSSFLLK